ncbi:sugar transporter [Perkinsus olseni]|uniref:Sugar transporter SWEET1 n=2 Tax=Perkinsus olseni TaxID=32597 RepID=A0A7J6PB49_PEROL|nr:sugar transporter [Perkinsus olseni]KAF4753696.1 sugar transporter [Perkinsus olseni]
MEALADPAVATLPTMEVSLASIAPILGTVGSVLSVIQYLSCIPTFIEVSRRKSTGNLSPMPYCTTSLLSLLWVTYALIVPGRTCVLVVNSIALVFQLVYISVFLKFVKVKEHTSTLCATVIALYIATMFLASLTPSLSNTLGNCCVVVSICMYAAPLAVLPTIIKTRDSSCMPPLYSLTGMISASVWSSYGLAAGDAHIIIPNGSGAVLCAVQLVIWVIFRASSPSKANPVIDEYAYPPEDIKPSNYVSDSESTVCSIDYLLLDP